MRAYGVTQLTNDDALRTFDGLAANPAVAYREEPSDIRDHWPGMGTRATASPRVWMDACLAAFAIAGGMTMVTTDDDFNAFKARGFDLVMIETP